jgi:fermentation-respiration switch protein FrsA (DUF1100 family)
VITRAFSRERLIGLAVSLVLGGAAFVFGLRWMESKMTFQPVRVAQMSAPRGAEDVWFNSADGTRLHGWFFRTEATPSNATLIYFHGNGGNISNVAWVGQRFAKQGFDVLLFDYRGYGASAGEAGAESDLYADGDAALAFVVNNKGVRAEQIVLYGQSLGTTVAVDVASRRQVGAVVLESGLSSASSVAETALPWLPRWLHFLGKNRFDSARKLANVKAPVLITHGDPDPVIPTSEARLLFAAANEPKKLLTFAGAGHNVFGSQGEQYFDQVEQFIRASLTARL